MALRFDRLRNYLRKFDFSRLFIEELGWDQHDARVPVEVDGQSFTLDAVAEKRGVQIFVCSPDATGKIPDRTLRRKIDRKATEVAYEHLIIYQDAQSSEQVWQWVAREPGKPVAYRESSYRPGDGKQSGEALVQKLSLVYFSLDDEEAIDLSGASQKLRDAFDRDGVSRKFYERFNKEHVAFLRFIEGITQQGDKEWYASLMLNRLMFIYFIQRKGFLAGDVEYLRNRLRQVQGQRGKGKFLSFYRYFLLKLFHEGFAKQKENRALTSELADLVGDVPYLNGGLFDLHELEQSYTGIDIADEVFEKLFDFFDQYDWHLDNRPLRSDKEINPDVLGYIFEKYINKKQMGAY